jgi:hypothetical protein
MVPFTSLSLKSVDFSCYHQLLCLLGTWEIREQTKPKIFILLLLREGSLLKRWSPFFFTSLKEGHHNRLHWFKPVSCIFCNSICIPPLGLYNMRMLGELYLTCDRMVCTEYELLCEQSVSQSYSNWLAFLGCESKGLTRYNWFIVKSYHYSVAHLIL